MVRRKSKQTIISSVVYILHLKGYNRRVRKYVYQLRYRPIIEIDKDPMENMADITKEQLGKHLSTLPSPDFYPKST